MKQVRVLTNEGVEQFSSYLNGLEGNPGAPVPVALLTDETTSADFKWTVAVEDQKFSDRFHFGKYLNAVLEHCDKQAIAHDRGLWTWLALMYFDQLCPADGSGARKPYKEYAYVLSSGKGLDATRHYYRHLVRTPYVLVRDHQENAQVLLSAPLSRRGELVEQLAARQGIIGSRSIIAAVQKLYFDKAKNTFKRGAAGRERPGSVDRLIRVLQQLQLTFDLHTMTGDQIVDLLLPAEFDEWKEAPKT